MVPENTGRTRLSPQRLGSVTQELCGFTTSRLILCPGDSQPQITVVLTRRAARCKAFMAMNMNPFATKLHPTAHPWKLGRWRFVSDADGSVVASAFILPLLRQGGSTWVLLQEEDEPDDSYRDLPAGQRLCTPKLSMLGGKVSDRDVHWVATATREVGEETGMRPDGSTLLSSAALEDIQNGFQQRCAAKLSEAGTFSGYVREENACAMLVFYPVPESHREEWTLLPERYALEFSGEVDHQKERHGTRLMWVRVGTASGPTASTSAAGGVPCLDLAGLTHVCVGEDPVRCAARCGRDGACPQLGQPLRTKRVLELGLPLLAQRRDALAQYLIANRLHHLIGRCSHGERSAPSPSVGQLTHKFMSAWAKGGKLHELERAMEQQPWLSREVDKVAGSQQEPHQRRDKKRARDDDDVAATVLTTYAARHLLIKYEKSRNPVSKRCHRTWTVEPAAAPLARRLRCDSI